MQSNYLETIFSLMQNERENTTILSNNLKSFYDDAYNSEKKIIDNIVICICGCSLDTIIYHIDQIILENQS